MKHPFATFLLVVLAPCVAASGTAFLWAGQEAAEIDREAHARAARLVYGVLEQEIGRVADSLIVSGGPLETAPDDPAAARAAAGDTLTALRPVERGLEAVVMLGDGNGGVRGGRALVPLAAVNRAARLAGYGATPYLGGRRWPGSEEAATPAALPPEVAAALDDEGSAAGPAPEGGALYGPGGTRGPVVWVTPRADPAPPVSLGFAATLGLLFLFTALAAWIQLTRWGIGRRVRPRFRHVVLLALLAAVTFAFLVVRIDAEHRERARTATADDLTVALAVAASEGVASSPRRVAELTGFAATRVEGGRAAESTAADGGRSVEEVSPPPPSFTSSGRVVTPEGPSNWVALAVEPGAFLVLTAPLPHEEISAFRRKLAILAGVLAVWLLAAGAVLGPREIAAAKGKRGADGSAAGSVADAEG